MLRSSRALAAALLVVAACSGRSDSVQFTNSFIQRADYTAASQLLTVHFTDGSVYEYASVPRAVFDRWRTSAPMSGVFFNQSIRTKFAFKLVTARPPKPPPITPPANQPPPTDSGASIRCPATMTSRPVASAVLDAVAYDPASRCLMLYFDSGHVYRYGDVPPATYQQLLRPGTDSYFNRSIRNRFRMERVQEPRGGR